MKHRTNFQGRFQTGWTLFISLGYTAVIILALFPACKKQQDEGASTLGSAQSAEPTPSSAKAVLTEKTPPLTHPAEPTPSPVEPAPTAKQEADPQPPKLQPSAGAFEVVEAKAAEPVYLSNHGSGTVSNAPAPISPTPDGTYILVKYISVTTDSGIYGLHPGETLRFLHDSGAYLHVKCRDFELDVEKDSVTNDQAVADKAVALDEQERAKNAQWGKMQEELARKQETKRLLDNNNEIEKAKKRINGDSSGQ